MEKREEAWGEEGEKGGRFGGGKVGANGGRSRRRNGSNDREK